MRLEKPNSLSPHYFISEENVATILDEKCTCPICDKEFLFLSGILFPCSEVSLHAERLKEDIGGKLYWFCSTKCLLDYVEPTLLYSA